MKVSVTSPLFEKAQGQKNGWTKQFNEEKKRGHYFMATAYSSSKTGLNTRAKPMTNILSSTQFQPQQIKGPKY